MKRVMSLGGHAGEDSPVLVGHTEGTAASTLMTLANGLYGQLARVCIQDFSLESQHHRCYVTIPIRFSINH